MRFIDVAIPHFGDESDSPPAERPVPVSVPSRHFSRGGGFLQRPQIEEYNLEENESVLDDEDAHHGETEEPDQFFEAPEITSDVSRIDFGSTPSRLY